MRWTRRGLAPAVAALACGLLAAPAQATILFERGSEIWAMADDGSAPLVLIPLSAAPGMSSLADPHAAAAGGPVVFTGSTTANRYGSFQYGDNATGVYVWDRGAVARLSGPPGPCTGPASPHCTSRHVAPEVAGDGRYVAELFVTTGSTAGSLQGTSALFGEGLDNSGYQSLATNCPDGEYGADPSPNPANPAQVAYGGHRCATADENGGPTTYQLWAGALQFTDDSTLIDPSWRPDGGALVWAETANGGGDSTAGIWISEGPGGAKRQIASLPGTDILNAPSPRFMGDRIVFSYDVNYNASDSSDGDGGRDIYTLPVGCNGCTIDQATRLTSDGGSEAPAWTGATVADLLPASNGGGGGGGSGVPPSGNGEANPPSVSVAFARGLRLGSVLGRGLPVTLRVDESATVRISVTVDARTARRYRLARGSRAGAVTIGSATRSFSAAGRGSVRVRIGRSYARKLRRARSLVLRVAIDATDRAGNSRTTRKTVRLRR